MASVTLYTYDASDATKATPVTAVTVFVFSSDGTTFIDSGDTDSSGEVTFELPLATYWVRFFKQGFSFAKKLSVEVTEDSEFEVSGSNLDARPPATTANLCRISGYVLGAAGQYLPEVTAEFMLLDTIRISGGMATGNEKVIAVSDSDGYFEFDLLRNCLYDAVVESYGNTVFPVYVPDTSSAGFTDLIWPYVARVDLGSSTVSVAADASTTVSVSAVLSSGRATPYTTETSTQYASGLVSVESSDTDVATVSLSQGILTIEGVSAGSCTISFSSSFGAAARTPEVSVTFDTVAVTVT